MSCSSCSKSKLNGTYTQHDALAMPPLRSNDMMILENGQVHRMAAEEWPDDTNKLLLFVEPNNPTSASEVAALNGYVDQFQALGTDVFVATSDHMHVVTEWLQQSNISDLNYKIISSYLLPTRLNIMNNGRNKLATVFITKEADVVIQEAFPKVGRSIADLYRTVAGYTQHDYIPASWQPGEALGGASDTEE